MIEEQIHTQRYEEYGMNELVPLPENDEPATPDHTDLVFITRK